MQLYSIASGSSGNCIYLGEEDGGILIDAGISRKRIVTGLERKGLSLDDIKAIFITSCLIKAPCSVIEWMNSQLPAN